MKKILIVMTSLVMLASCSNNGGESGAVNDGFSGAGDPNGGLPDSNRNESPRTDTSSGEHRVDLSNRDTSRGY
jgi:hypothetical protein